MVFLLKKFAELNRIVSKSNYFWKFYSILLNEKWIFNLSTVKEMHIQVQNGHKRWKNFRRFLSQSESETSKKS